MRLRPLLVGGLLVSVGGTAFTAAPAAASPAVVALKLPGTWSLSWSWSDGDSGNAPITFTKAGHTFSVTSESGTWKLHHGTLTFRFTSSNSCHGRWTGTFSKTTRQYTGTMASSCNGTGSWSMKK